MEPTCKSELVWSPSTSTLHHPRGKKSDHLTVAGSGATIEMAELIQPTNCPADALTGMDEPEMSQDIDTFTLLIVVNTACSTVDLGFRGVVWTE